MLYVISRCLQCYSDKCFKKFSCWEKRGVTHSRRHFVSSLPTHVVGLSFSFMLPECQSLGTLLPNKLYALTPPVYDKHFHKLFDTRLASNAS